MSGAQRYNVDYGISLKISQWFFSEGSEITCSSAA